MTIRMWSTVGVFRKVLQDVKENKNTYILQTICNM